MVVQISKKTIFVMMSLLAIGMIFSPLVTSAFQNQGNFLNRKNKHMIDVIYSIWIRVFIKRFEYINSGMGLLKEYYSFSLAHSLSFIFTM